MSCIEHTEDHALSRAGEDYLEAIYRISLESGHEGAPVRSVDVAEQLGVSKANMVEQSRYGRVTLTPEGEKYAALVWRAHRALRSFLESDLRVEPETADAEACLMEHVLSADTMERLIAYLERQGIVVPD